MTKRLILYILAIAFIFLFSGSIAEARLGDDLPTDQPYTISLGTCKTTWDISKAGDCGTSCPALCDSQSINPSKCEESISAPKTQPWGEYELKEEKYSFQSGRSSYWKYRYTAYYTATRICSLGDKYNPSGNLTQLYSGQCSCTTGNPPSVGGQYKVCCQANGDLKTSTRNSIQVGSISSGKHLEDDDYSWPESDCPLYGGGQETVYGAFCPQPPTITLTGNGSSDRLEIANNTSVKLEWTINGYDRVGDTNITGVINYPRSGSYPATDSAPPYIQFPKGTPKGTTHTLWIEAYDDYRGYSIPSATDPDLEKVPYPDPNRSVKRRVELTLISTGDNIIIPDCPIQLPKSASKTKCSDFNYTPQRTDGKKNPDGTTTDYTKDKISFIDPPIINSNPSCKPQDNQSVGCYNATCSRCSNSPSTSGKFASWSSDKVDYDAKQCLAFNSVTYTPVSGSDPNCSVPPPPSEACVINGLYISPATLEKGKNTNIGWEAKPNPKTPEDLIESCEMTAKDSKGEKKTAEKAAEFSKSFGPITEDTTYALKCTGLSKKTCETSPVTVKVGCEIVNFSSDGSKISDTEYETTSSSTLLKWKVDGSDSCNINGSQVAPAAEGSKSYSSLSKGANSFKLSCETRSNPSVLCEKTINVKKIDAPSPGQCSVDTFTASPPSINQKDGRTSTLSWTSTQASGCTLLEKSFGPSDSYVVSPSPPSTTYTVTCATSGSSSTCSKSLTIPVTPPPASSCVGSYSDVSINVSASPQCLPSQPGSGTNTVVSYGASAGSSCVSAIGGGSPSNSNISCATPGWNPTSGKQTVSPSKTTSYSVSCSRPDYTCSRSDQTYTSGTKSENSSACESARAAALKNPSVASATCVNTGCTRYYTSSSYADRSTTCTSYSRCTSTGSCENRKPKGYCSRTYSSCSDSSDCIQAESCVEKKCERSGNACTSSANCTQAESCQNIRQIGTCDNGGGSCGYNNQYPNSDCTYQYDCESNYKCNSYACIKDSGGTYYEGYRLDITSKPICGSSSSNSTQVRVITKPNSPTLTAEGAKNVSGSTYQILLNRFFNLSWSVSAPDSLVSTILRCTASGKGDPETWDDEGLNGFGSSGNVYDLFKKYLSPDGSTTYSLWCQNQDSILPSSCYNDGPPNSLEVKVYTPDLQEKGPSSFNFVKKFMGMIGGGWAVDN